MDAIELLKELDDFLKWLESNTIIAHLTAITYVTVVKQFLIQLKGDELTKENVIEFIKKKRRMYVKSALKHYLKFKGMRDILIEVEDFKFKEPDRKIRDEPTREELGEILKKITTRNDAYWVLRLLYNTGARVSEILKLRPIDIKFEKNQLHLTTKGGHLHACDVPPNIMEELRQYLDKKIIKTTVKGFDSDGKEVKREEEFGMLSGDRCFFHVVHFEDTPPKRPLASAYVKFRREIRRLKGLSDKEKSLILRTHNFRRAAIDDIVKDEGDLSIAKDTVGHMHISSTEVYLLRKEKERKRKIGSKILARKKI